jgi:hypothetical protein
MLLGGLFMLFFLGISHGVTGFLIGGIALSLVALTDIILAVKVMTMVRVNPARVYGLQLALAITSFLLLDLVGTAVSVVSLCVPTKDVLV